MNIYDMTEEAYKNGYEAGVRALAKQTEIKINLNEHIKFKLTDCGKDIYYHQFDEINERITRNGGKPITPRMPEVDENGYTSMQLWCFIQLYGNYIGMAKPNVVEPLEIIYAPTEKGGVKE